MSKKLIVIGAGPGGYESAIRAAQLGLEVVLIEKRFLGGTCLNWGCIPTKTLWKIADLYKDIGISLDFGIEVNEAKLNEELILKRKKHVIERLRKGIGFLLDSYDNLKLVEGEARFLDEKTVRVKTEKGEEDYTADYILVATGSKDFKPPIKGIDQEGVVTSTGLLDMEKIPKSMVVIGSGVIGLEFASIYSIFGTKVTVVGGELAGSADGEIQKRLKSILRSENLTFRTGVRAEEIKKTDNGFEVISKKEGKDKVYTAEGEVVLVATGRSPNTDNLDGEKANLEIKKGGIVVDENFKAGNNIFAIGDCVFGNNQLAHVASSQGIHVVEKLAGKEPKTNLDIVPAVIFTIPEVAQVGKTEEQLKEEGIEYSKSKFLYSGNSKAVSMDATEGFIKILASKDLKSVYGVHIVGYDANTMIHFGAIAMNNNIGVDGLSDMIWAHPTISEAFMDAAHILEGKSINTPNI
ncbi:MAG: dihydrolipoyl dehydrogenase [Tissierellia bacterium]|nr:dihydrolipoyl dehydrogenase [Tissierellia bacterium]